MRSHYRYRSIVRVLTLVLTSFTFLNAVGQVSIPGSYFTTIDKLTDTTTLSLYRSISYNDVSSFDLVNPTIRASYNSTYPRGFNDGPLWKGKGLTSELHFGFVGKKGRISYAIVPAFFYSQNLSYDIGQIRPFGYDFSFRPNGEQRIDWVQRYGNSGFMDFHLGQSEVMLEWGKTTWAISTQNYSLGPSIYNPIVISRQGGGFPHFRFGVNGEKIKLFKKNIGKIESNLIVGLLKESDYFDDINDNDTRYFNAFTFSYAPSFIKGLTLGFNRMLYKQTRYFEKEDLFSIIYNPNDGIIDGDTLSTNDLFDQLASISVDWKFPESDLRVYAEFSKNDFTSGGAGFRFFAIEPEHSRSFTIGLEKIFQTKNKTIRFGYEHSNLSRNATSIWRPSGMYYTHEVNKQGYTNDGQMIGAGIGPGGNSDHINIRVEDADFVAGILLQRIENNRDYLTYYIQNANLHDIEYSLGFSLQKTISNVLISGEVTFSHNYNKYYQADQSNAYLGFSAQLLLFE
ncbi:hypothetical protein [Ekhidna sp.]